MACGCGKGKVSATNRTAASSFAYQVMAFTGKRPGAIAYFADGTRSYSLGNTQFSQQARVRAEDYPALRAKYGNQLMILPGSLEGVFLPLGEPIESVDILAPHLMALEDNEIETVGEILASDRQAMLAILGTDTDTIVDALRLRVGLEVAYA